MIPVGKREAALPKSLAGWSFTLPQRTIRARKQFIGGRVVTVLVCNNPAFLPKMAEMLVARMW
jgi:hypothetical protein